MCQQSRQKVSRSLNLSHKVLFDETLRSVASAWTGWWNAGDLPQTIDNLIVAFFCICSGFSMERDAIKYNIQTLLCITA